MKNVEKYPSRNSGKLLNMKEWQKPLHITLLNEDLQKHTFGMKWKPYLNCNCAIGKLQILAECKIVISIDSLAENRYIHKIEISNLWLSKIISHVCNGYEYK